MGFISLYIRLKATYKSLHDQEYNTGEGVEKDSTGANLTGE
jgi:hypothetical protein